jgi:murein DD-endopeptidase MepM/ murein hydrolase activator NlpD
MKRMRSYPCFWLVLWLAGVAGAAAVEPLVRLADLDLGEAQEVTLSDGRTVNLRLVAVEEQRDELRHAVRSARVQIELNGIPVTLTSATYHLPITVAAAGVQIDCPVTQGYVPRSQSANIWSLEKAARFRLWPAGSPWMTPGSFTYPVRQRWFASATQMANEPTYVNGEERPGIQPIYYHYGLDFGGAEGLDEIVAATSGLVVSAAGDTLPEHVQSPVAPRYDVIYLLDERGWYYRYSHLKTIEVKAGERVQRGQRLGLLGKEGGSGGWAHLHLDITSRMPSGAWGVQDAYAYAWEAWMREHQSDLIAVARPHHFVATGAKVALDGSRSWSAAGTIARHHWTFTDGTNAEGALVERTYSHPGHYSERLEITDASGRRAVDFSIVQVIDPARPGELPPSIHAAYHPTLNLKAGELVTFKVRTFRTEATGETWDFGDGSARVTVHSDANAQKHAAGGYAITTHRYSKPGQYLARVEHTNARGEKAVAHLLVPVE